ncbi:MAG: NifB/NifX family molybdenum-iron cluster-binding protein [Pseudomonadota bacterium]|jgi:predicted Fe-Mo cluster-binding NifX family protein
MKIAVSIWEGKVSPVFDTASRLLVLDMEEKRETSRFEMYLDDQTLIRKCSRIQVLGVDVLICGAISRHFEDMLTTSGIRVIPWVCGSVTEILGSYMEGSLLHSRFSMPGCNQEKGRKRKKGKQLQRHCRRMED